MAIVIQAESSVLTGTAMTSFTLGIGPEFWQPHPGPQAGDLVILQVLQPDGCIATPPGWAASRLGHVCCRAWAGAGDPAEVTFGADRAQQWKVSGLLVPAGSWSPAGHGL